jgi:hypothetical protein
LRPSWEELGGSGGCLKMRVFEEERKADERAKWRSEILEIYIIGS